MKTPETLTVGDKVEIQQYNPETLEMEWVTTTIKRCNEKTLWFNGSGYQHIKRQTLISRSMFYRIPNQ